MQHFKNPGLLGTCGTRIGVWELRYIRDGFFQTFLWLRKFLDLIAVPRLYGILMHTWLSWLKWPLWHQLGYIYSSLTAISETIVNSTIKHNCNTSSTYTLHTYSNKYVSLAASQMLRPVNGSIQAANVTKSFKFYDDRSLKRWQLQAHIKPGWPDN